jgi:hypothetical protein
MQSDYGGIKSDLLGSAQEDIGHRKNLTRQFMDLSRADYETVAGRAMADVAGASEAGRQAEAMRLQGLGIDPASGRYRSMMDESRSQEALNAAMAANTARIDEKERVAGLTAQGLSLIDPTKSINTTAAIQDLQNSLLTQRSNLATTKAGLQSNLAQASGSLAAQTGNVAGGYAQTVAAPYGEMGATQLGVSQAAGGTPSTGTMTAGQYATQIGAKVIGKQADLELTPTIKAHLDNQVKLKNK